MRGALPIALAAALLAGCGAKTVTTHKDLVMSTMKERMGLMRECYATALVDEPGLEGRVAVQFTIGDEGTVIGAWAAQEGSVEGDEVFQSMAPLPEPVTQCILGVVEATRFPAPEGEEPTYVYPMTFKPE